MIFLLLAICTFRSTPHAQQLDSLSSLVASDTISDEAKVNILNELASITYRNNLDSSLEYALKAIQVAKAIPFLEGIAESHQRIGLVYYKMYQFDSALFHYEYAQEIYLSLRDSIKYGHISSKIANVYRKTNNYPASLKIYLNVLKIAKSQDNLELQGITHNNIGILYRQVGEYDSAISHYFEAIDLKMQFDPKAAGNSYTNIGLIKIRLQEYEEAQKYLQKALEIDIEQNDNWGIANNRAAIGMVYMEQDNLKEAKRYFYNALEGFKSINTLADVANTHNLIGETYIKEQNYYAALEELEKSRELFEQLDDKLELLTVWIDIASCHYYLNESKQAIQYASHALQFAQSLDALEEASKASEILFHIYGKLKDGNNSYEYAKLHMELKDSLFSLQKLDHIAQLESRRELSEIEQQNTLLTKENELRLKELEASTLKLQRQKTIQYALIICLIFAAVSGVVAFQYYSKKMKTIKLLQQLNAEIHSQKEHISQQADELQRVNGQMKNMNESLEDLVQERTQKIKSQNAKLREYAFSNSHEVRAPLANLLALIDLTKKDLSAPEHQEILDNIYYSASELDLIITKVNKLLEEEKL